MKSAEEYIRDDFVALLKREAGAWEHSDGEFGKPGYEEQWDGPLATSYVSQLTEAGTYAVEYFVGGPDHGIVAEGTVGEFSDSISARIAAFLHSAKETGSYLFYEDKALAAEEPSREDLPYETPEGWEE